MAVPEEVLASEPSHDLQERLDGLTGLHLEQVLVKLLAVLQWRQPDALLLRGPHDGPVWPFAVCLLADAPGITWRLQLPDAGYTKRPRRSSSESADASEARGESVINLIQTEDDRNLVRKHLKVARVRSVVVEASAATQMDAAVVSLAKGSTPLKSSCSSTKTHRPSPRALFCVVYTRAALQIADLTAQIERTQAKWAKLHE